MQEIESTHIVFDLKKWSLTISPNLREIFDFLMNIEKEIKLLLWYDQKTNQIKMKAQKTLEELSKMAFFLEQNGLHYNYTIKKEDFFIPSDFETHSIERTKVISLFAYMETLFCIMSIYNHETIKHEEIITHTNNDIRELIKKFILSDENTYYREHKAKLSKITANQFKALRNTLAHFYSVPEYISIVEDPIANHLIQNKLKNTIFISAHDLYELIRSASLLIFFEWNNDTVQNQEVFIKKINCVKEVVEKNWAKLIKINH